VIAIDTSAMMAIAREEPEAYACVGVLESEPGVLVSAGTLSEALIVATGQSRVPEITNLIARLKMTVVPVTESTARQVGEAYARWGKGIHPAGLNFGDCFAYALAKERNCPLLYVGGDFSKTDIKSAFSA
jgi:ribonuclease VapC